MKATIVELKQNIVSAKARNDEATKEAKQIERDMNEFSSNKDSKLAQLQASLDKLKKALAKGTASIKPIQQEMRDAMLEAEQCGGDLTSTQEQLHDAEVTLAAQQEEIAGLVAEQVRVKDAHDLAQANLEDEQAKLSGFDEELKSLEDAIRSKNSQTTEESLEQQKLGHHLEKLEKEQHAASQTLTHLSENHEWIEDEKEQFGRPNTPYEFKGQNMAECKSTLKNLTERFQGMKKKINPKVMNMIDNVEKKEASLKNMMRTVIRDKKKIEETIVQLDEYKKDALQKTWEKVNGDFGQIFNELLPGSFAKLDPPEGKTIAEGLEVKVSLGKVWKQSLTELSGGQRYVILFLLTQLILISITGHSSPCPSSWRSYNSNQRLCISWTRSTLLLIYHIHRTSVA
jgi:structural maintenance of chromosome 2